VGAAEALGGAPHDRIEHPRRISVHLSIPYPQNRPSLLSKKGVPPQIAIALGMLTTVQLDDELRLPTCEVGNVRSNRQLSRELRP
jgi:hypothetical protein